MFFKAPLACEQAVYSRHILASANHRDFLMELAFQVIYISLGCNIQFIEQNVKDLNVPEHGNENSSKEVTYSHLRVGRWSNKNFTIV